MNNLYSSIFTASALLLAGTSMAQRQAQVTGLATIRPVAAHHASTLRGGGAPANDVCSGAVNQDLAIGSTVTFTGDNTNAVDNDSLGMPAVWEMFTTTECANLEISYCGTTPAFGNGFVSIFSGCPFTSGIAAGSFNDTTCTDGNFTLFFEGVPAGTYYYAVMQDAANNAVGPYTLNVSATACAAVPANDECAGAVVLTPAADCVPVAATTAGATESMPAILCNGATSPNANDVWFSFVATAANHTITVAGVDNFDAVIEVFSGACSDLTSIGCEDGTFPPPVPVSEVMPLSGLTVGTTYYVRVYDYGHVSNGHNFTICVTIGAPAAVYCAPTSTNGPSDGDFIANVTLGDINNSTGGVNAYEDYTSMSTDLEQGGSYTLSITNGDYGDDDFAAWIDFNRDTIYQESENIGTFDGENGGEVISLPFTVPTDATLGATRLHVRCAYSAAPVDPCTAYSYGETEDYGINIVLASGVGEVNTAEVNVYPNPSKGDITISGANLSGKVSIVLMDMTGRTVFAEQHTMSANQPVTLPLNGKLAQGTYSLRLIGTNGISSRPVMIK
ncbi:MAG: T9SS type A sorting domain-containing protein [Bacteroidetes bacterium]|nr:T9SS type A sorting domain-containing protein [Bacteroidota bacterium]MBS1942024.1 T9SS type A sorting domain-containing protein [Bacteroidota bacterium]